MEFDKKLRNNCGKRLLVYFTICFAFGIYISTAYFFVKPDAAALWLAAGGVFAFLTAAIAIFLRLLGCRTKYLIFAGLYILFVIFGILRVYTFEFTESRTLSETFDEGAVIFGTVMQEPELSSTGKSTAITLGELESGGKKLGGKIIVYCRNKDTIPKRRDRISVRGKMKLTERMGDAEYAEYRRYLLSEGIRGTGFVHDFELIAEGYYEKTPYGLFKYIAEGCRNKILKAAESAEEGENRGLLIGIMLGDKSGMTEEQYAAIRESGFAHVAAVSGMHLSYLVLLLMAVFSFDRTNGRKLSQILILPFLLLFVITAEASPSVCRAALMCGIAAVGRLINRSGDAITTLFLAGLIILCQNPYVLYSIGFELSFGSAMGIIVFGRKIERKIPIRKKRKCMKPIKWAWGLTAMTIGAIIGIGYLCALYFEEVQFGGLIGNIFVMPLVIYVFLGGYTGALIYSICPPVGAAAVRILLNPALELLNGIFAVLSKMGLNMSVTAHGEIGAVLYLLACAAFYLILSIKRSD